MTGSNKILTVSYGTFSCTLEGFDDPFGTMRGIAEYFRDLAADDRYFGAEPPTPDVEMLQNIAQKDVQRRVEARVGETGIALRQVAEAVDEPVAQAPEPTPAPAPKPARQVEEAETFDSGPLAFDDEYLMADEPEDALTVDAQPAPVEKTAPAETVAEKLRRIRAVVSKSIEAKEQQEPFSPALAEADDAGADDEAAQKRSRALTETIASITADLSEEFDAEDEEDQPEAEDALRANATAGDVDKSAMVNILSDADEEDEDEDDVGEEAADSQEIAADDPTDDPTDDTSEPIAVQAKADDVEGIRSEESFADASNDDDDDDDDEIGMDDTEVGRDDDAAIVASVGKIVANSTDAEVIHPDADAAADTDVATDEEPQRRTTAPLAPIHDTNGDVGRLLKETDQKLNDDDGIRRRRVISQMRAAVAATKADRIFSRILSRKATDAQEQSPYRSDLDRAITRQPTDESIDPGAIAARPPPLVLVSSQRVDTDDDDARELIIQPQRVEKVDGDIEESASFKDFATKMGATELPDLLEAAAAYSAFVEGEPHFSRPEIMKRVARVDPALQLSREAGLRSFGQLLRQGKILKLQRGQFTIGEETRFNPAARIAG